MSSFHRAGRRALTNASSSFYYTTGRSASASKGTPRCSSFSTTSSSLDNNNNNNNSNDLQRHFETPLPVDFERKGTGGRSSYSGVTAAVFGATGFLGRYVVNHLAKNGSRVILPTRCSENHRQHLKPMGDLGQIVQFDYSMRDDEAIKYAVERANVVINLIGREWETRNFSFDDVHRDFPRRLAEACKESSSVKRLIHVSALGADVNAKSKYYRSKAEGDEEVKRIFPRATIVKPAKLVGVEDRFLNVFAEHASKFPFVPLTGLGESKHQPVSVDDVAIAISQLPYDEDTVGKEYVLAGEKTYTMEELAKLTVDVGRFRSARVGYVPKFVYRLLSAPHEFLLNKVPFPLPTPKGLTRSFIDAQDADYVKKPHELGFKELGMTPAKMDGITIDYLRSYRSGGYLTNPLAKKENFHEEARVPLR
jgi:NADH dehydrogenase (ubiquinone) 1 alpha subcomplex subunit 9